MADQPPPVGRRAVSEPHVCSVRPDLRPWRRRVLEPSVACAPTAHVPWPGLCPHGPRPVAYIPWPEPQGLGFLTPEAPHGWLRE